MNFETWKKWDGLHDTADQKKRLERAYHADNTPLSVSHDDGTGQFQGSSGRYDTDLEKCTCVDFVRRKQPCKHMYRLAIELGCFGEKENVKNDQLARKIPKNERNEFIIELIGIIENYSDEEQIELKNIMLEILYRKQKSLIYKDTTVIRNAIADGILASVDAYSYFFRKMQKDDMLKAIASQGDVLPASCKLKKDVVVWLISNKEKYGPILFPNCAEISLGYELSLVSLSVYKYLHRKYDESARIELIYDPETDRDYEVEKSLPDDFETGLLNLFDTNPTNNKRS